MIRIQRDGAEIELTYEEFIREIREGRISAQTPVRSDVLTSGTWKLAGQLQFFRSWAPSGTIIPAAEAPTEPQAVPSEGRTPEPPPPVIIRTSAPPGQAPAEAADEPLPWERIEAIGFFRAFFGTIRMALTQVDAFARGIGAGEIVMPALVFGLLVVVVAALFDAIYSIGMIHFMGPMLEQMKNSMPGLFGEAGMPTPRDILFQHGLGILFYPALIFLWGGFVHLLLRIFGRPGRGFSSTLRVANYAMAPQILTIIPFCGSLIAWIWTIVLTVRGLMSVHRTGGLAATMAALLPLLAFCLWMALANMQPLLRSLPHAGFGS